MNIYIYIYIYMVTTSLFSKFGNSVFSVEEEEVKFCGFSLYSRGVALGEWRITCINKHEKIADLMTKNLLSGVKKTKFCKMLLNFFTTSIEVKNLLNHTVVVTVVKVLPGR